MQAGKIIKVAGPLVVADGMVDAKMYDVVKVGLEELIGEIVEIKGDKASIQVYEETGGIGPGDPVITTGMPLSVELGPGLLQSIYDGIQRPLELIYGKVGDLITRGVNVPSLNREKKWAFTPTGKTGDKVQAGDILGTLPETRVITHKVLVPPGIEGEIVKIAAGGEYTITDTIARIKTKNGEQDICMLQKWPVRISRPLKGKLSPKEPLSTGQRIIDTLFPLAKGGTACVPGPFGSGKTVVQHQLAKWASAEIVVYIGCGERGNEMTDVLIELPEIEDPRTGESLMQRTVLIANTSNMPVAAREASVYTGITLAEYYRDMGYHVALMADSTSRWAEALREMSGRLEEMPGEEGYPAYLATKIADFYERAGRVNTLGSNGREGSISVIGAVSPPGGDMSDPVVQATLKVVKVFWGLDANLAYRRHFPAINWLQSYSLYMDNLKDYLTGEIARDWVTIRQKAMALLQKEAELEEIVRLIGKDSLSPTDQLTLEITKIIREDFLHQNAFHAQDSYTSLNKQYNLLKLILTAEELFRSAVEAKIPLKRILSIPALEEIAKAKFITEDKPEEIEAIGQRLREQVGGLK
ncbi:MAG: V-type ATP synthase subunit A [Candidatus Schekmanbacteria bacterium]|nr:V-type ATP synthase subunit A [Candidatus Schekmanbacteria bacterium]